MFCLDNTDTLEAWSDTDAKVDYSIHGLVGTTFANLATGTLNATPNTVVYTAGAATSIVSVMFTNTDSSVVTVNFKLDPENGGNDKFLLNTVSLGIGYTLTFDGQRIRMTDASGRLMVARAYVNHAASHRDGEADDLLSGPGAIGGTTPATGAFTTIDLTGGQIAFPGDAVPSGDPNTLDDYEKGTWTAGVSFGGGVTGITYNASYVTGGYTKIGNVVLFAVIVVLTSKGSDAGIALGTGLPFTHVGVDSLGSSVAFHPNQISFADIPRSRVVNGGNTLYMEEVTKAGVPSSLTNVDFADNSTFWMGGHYQV